MHFLFLRTEINNLGTLLDAHTWPQPSRKPGLQLYFQYPFFRFNKFKGNARELTEIQFT